MTSTIIAICALIVSTISVILALWEGLENRKNNRLSVKPILIVNSSFSNQAGFIGIELENTGLGPAIIKELKYYLDGKIEKDHNKLAQICSEFVRIPPGYITVAQIANQASIKSNNSKILISMRPADFLDGEYIDRFREFVNNRIGIYIKYESIYGEESETGRIIN